MAATTFFTQASANRRNSFLLALFVVAVLGLLGFFVGYAIVGDPAGGVAATGAALLLGGVARGRDVLRRATSSSSRRPAPGRSTHRRRRS